MYFDTHTHYGLEQYDEERDAIFRELHMGGTGRVMISGFDLESSERTCEIVRGYEGPLVLYASAGIHPLYVKNLSQGALDELEGMITRCGVKAVGELGLDRYEKGSKEPGQMERQRKFFERQLEICERHSLPAVIHSRAAAKETCDILLRHQLVSGVIHGFSYSAEIAEMLCGAGWHIGIGAVVCKEGAKKIKDVVKAVPKERILAETDSPYGAAGIAEVVRQIARIRGCDEEEMAKVIYDNSVRLFGCQK